MASEQELPLNLLVRCVVVFGKFMPYFGLQNFAQRWSDKNATDVLISSVI